MSHLFNLSEAEGGKSEKSNRYYVSVGEFSNRELLNSERGDEIKIALEKWAEDDQSYKTWSRIFVEKILMKFKWYYTNKDEEGSPDLRKGWAFYEHLTLKRRYENTLKQAPPGESGKKTELYNFFTLPESAMKDWGSGILLYFSMTRVYAIALFIAGLFSLRNMIYFDSDDYDGGDYSPGGLLGLTLRGSAVCNTTEWVICEQNYCDLNKMDSSQITYATETGGGGLTFVERLSCPHNDQDENAIWKAGLWSLCVGIIMIIITFTFNVYQSIQQTVIDEDVVTASDYSVRVLNPPKDAYDPDKWRDFFSNYEAGKGVTLVTVLLNNAELLKALKIRRYFRNELQKRLPNVNLERVDLSDPVVTENIKQKAQALREKRRSCFKVIFNYTVRPILRLLNKYLDLEVLQKKIEEKTAEIEELQKKDYEVSSVIITFESEQGQRTALNVLQASVLDIRKQNTADKHVFRHTTQDGEEIDVLLDVVQPTEPSTLRYLDFDNTFFKSSIQFMITLIITCGLIALSAYLVALTRRGSGPFAAGVLTTALNILIPIVVKLLVLIERHAREDDRQRSMYIKVTLFRWVNTAIATKFITPFNSTLGAEKDDLLVAINGILWSEFWLVPLLSVSDIMGNLSKHFFAPRAKVEFQMFLCFTGTNYNLADKYTDITKIVFLCYYYCPLNPSILLLGSLTLLVRYYADKFCLLRLWGAAPALGTQMAEFSRKYFLSLAVVIGVIISAYDWALFNFDRVCLSDVPVDKGTYAVTIKGENMFSYIDVTQETAVRVCKDSVCCEEIGFKFPPIPSLLENDEFKWMTNKQREISQIYGLFSAVVLIVFLVGTFGNTLWNAFQSLFVGRYEESAQGQDQNIDFSNLEGVEAYIPQIKDSSFPYPLLACDIDEVKQNLIGFIPDGESYDDDNLIFDVPYEGMKRKKIIGDTLGVSMIAQHDSYEVQLNTEKERHLFSVVKHWPHGGK